MKRNATAAIAAALALASAGVPALGKERSGTAPAARLNPAVLGAARGADAALASGNVATAEPLVAQAEAAATGDLERYVAAALRLRVEQAKVAARQQAGAGNAGDQTALARALDALIANPSTPAAVRGGYVAQRGELAYNGRQYRDAVQLFTQARQLGYTDTNLDLMIVRAKIDSGDIAGGSADLERIVSASSTGAGRAPIEYYRFAIGRSNKAHLIAQTVSWMNRYLAAYPVGQSWYEVLVTYGFSQDSTAKLDNQQKVDLFRLMRASGGLADQAFYLDYAQTAQSAGLPLEAQAVLREGLANGKIPAGNADAKAMQAVLTRAVAGQGNLATLETKANAAASGAVAGQAGDAYLGTGNYAKAAALYRTALAKGGVDANVVNTRLGIALARSGDKAGALEAFGKVQGSPRGEIASFWTTWLNNPTTGGTAAS